jgi:putative restriction endonuclease
VKASLIANEIRSCPEPFFVSVLRVLCSSLTVVGSRIYVAAEPGHHALLVGQPESDFAQETAGGYLWSPKRSKNGARNPFYEFMREDAPGDLVLSFEGTHIRAIGVARSHAYECPKPPEFGSAAPNWSLIDWKVDLGFQILANQVRPVDQMPNLRHLLPARYSPLLANGRGLQSVYLTEVPSALMQAIVQLIGGEARILLNAPPVAPDVTERRADLAEWEEHLRQEVEADATIGDTEKTQIVLARRGQGIFKENVRKLEKRCRITGVERLVHLRASHIRPWRDSDNQARPDGENGLLLTPSIDHLFDLGFISFDDKGRLLISPVAHTESLRRMGIQTDASFSVGGFSEGQRRHLDYHRERVFLEARTH